MYGFRLEQQGGASIMSYRRYETRPSGLLVVEGLGATAIMTDSQLPGGQTSSGLYLPDILETTLFSQAGEQPSLPTLLDPSNDSVQKTLEEFNVAAKAAWHETLAREGGQDITVRTIFAERHRETPNANQTTEFDGYVATPAEITAIEVVADYLQSHSTSKDEPGTGLYL